MFFEFLTEEDWFDILTEFAEAPSVSKVIFDLDVAEALAHSCIENLRNFSVLTSFSKQEYTFLACALWNDIAATEACGIEVDISAERALADKLADLAEL